MYVVFTYYIYKYKHEGEKTTKGNVKQSPWVLEDA
jgi:hypothetical protein